MNEKFEAKLEKIRTHLKNNKDRYYIGGMACTFIAGGVAYAILRQHNDTMLNQVHEGVGNNLAKCKIENYYQKTITKYGKDVGRPGNRIVDLTTGKEYGSETLGALDVGATISQMSDHLHGKRDHLSGHQFIFVTDAA